MELLHRRRFLKQAVLGSGAIPILAASQLNSQQLSVQTSRVRPVHGRILNISGAVLTLEAIEGTRSLSVDRARIWRGGDAPAAHLRIGDVVWARGLQMPDGRLRVMDLWANIVNVSGRVDTVISSTTFVMQWGAFGVDWNLVRKTTVTMTSETVVNEGSLISPRNLIAGKPVQVIGTAVDEAHIRATRVFV